ncbi:MAG: hypothetical protein KIS67_20275 [Verrucomicrobiae bacterium]|nr:hypothetical protein [Verrucomicrobiae bacterium]
MNKLCALLHSIPSPWLWFRPRPTVSLPDSIWLTANTAWPFPVAPSGEGQFLRDPTDGLWKEANNTAAFHWENSQWRLLIYDDGWNEVQSQAGAYTEAGLPMVWSGGSLWGAYDFQVSFTAP